VTNQAKKLEYENVVAVFLSQNLSAPTKFIKVKGIVRYFYEVLVKLAFELYSAEVKQLSKTCFYCVLFANSKL